MHTFPAYGPAAVSVPCMTDEVACGSGPDDAAWQGALRLADFAQAGGIGLPVTPVEAALLATPDALLVRFSCAEPNPAYRIPRGACRGEPGPAWPVFNDSVTVQVRNSWEKPEFVTVAVASAGDHYARRFAAWPMPPNAAPEPVTGYDVRVERTVPDRWVALVRLPWAFLGGRPGGSFGFNLQRTRWQSGECTAPIGLPLGAEPSPDLFIEATLAPAAAASCPAEPLAQLPSGAWRWHLPLVRHALTSEEQQDLSSAMYSTGQDSDGLPALQQRLAAIERTLSLLLHEGFSFHPDGGAWSEAPGDLRPDEARRRINAALHADDTGTACRLADAHFRHLARLAKGWFADGSPGNRYDWAWAELDQIRRVRTTRCGLRITGVADGHEVEFTLSIPAPGVVRLHGPQTGEFAFPEPRPVRVTRPDRDTWRIRDGALTLTVGRKPLRIDLGELPRPGALSITTGFIRFCFDVDGNITASDLYLPFAPGSAVTAVTGFGERFNALDQRGQVVTHWNLDAWEGAIYGLLNHSYKSIPLLHLDPRLSLFMNSDNRLRADVGAADPSLLRLTTHGPVLDAYVFTGTPAQRLDAYTQLTGRPLLPPRWVFEPWMGGGWGRWKHGPLQNSTGEILNAVQRFTALGVQHSAVYAEGEASDDPRLFTELAGTGIRPLCWMNSTLSLAEMQKLLPDVPEAELPILRRAGGGIFPYIDFTHPCAAALLRAFWQRRLALGMAGSMVDFGDLVPQDAVFHDGTRGDAMHNLYALEYHHRFRDAFAEVRGDDHALFGRGASPGSQRWVCQFAGDHQSNLRGLAAALRGALNLSSCGFSTWGSDIGGYLGWPDTETYCRWVEFGCFSPIMRTHGTEPREPWEFGPDAEGIYTFYTWLRQNLLGYIVDAAAEASRTGMPIMRSMAFAFPECADVAASEDQYMFGPAVLVAPMLTPGTTRRVCLPPAGGNWVDFWSGATLAPGWHDTPAPMERIPLFLAPGAAFPVRLRGDLAWGADLRGNAVEALVVTPPPRPGAWQSGDASKAEELRAEPVAGGFELRTTGFGETRYLLVYGAAVCAVEVNGIALPELAESERAAQPPGWFADAGRVVVRLPCHRERRIRIACGA